MKNHTDKPSCCFRLWPFLRRDSRFVPDYLQEQEAKGLRFCSISQFFPLVKYERVKPTQAIYCIDVFPELDMTKIMPYLELCEESGWEAVWQWGAYKIFRQKSHCGQVADGANDSSQKESIGIQTDSVLQQELMAEVTKKDSITAAALAFLACVILFFTWGLPINRFYFYTAPMTYQWMIFLVTLLGIGQATSSADGLWRRRAFLNGEDPWGLGTPESEKRAKCRGIACGVGLQLLFWGILSIYMIRVEEHMRIDLAFFVPIFVIGSLHMYRQVVDDREIRTKVKSLPNRWTGWIMIAVLLIIACIFMVMPSHDEGKIVEPYHNFFMDEVQQRAESSGSDLGYGEVSITAAGDRVAEDLMQILREKAEEREEHQRQWKTSEEFDEELAGQKRLTPEEVPAYGLMAEGQLQKYGAYDEGYIYPLLRMVLLKKGTRILYTNEESAKNREH